MAEDMGGIQASMPDDSVLDPKFARLRSSIQRLEAELLVLQRQMQQGTGDTRAMAETLDMLSSAHTRLTEKAAMSADAMHQVHTGLDAVGRASNSTANDLMIVGRSADNMQSVFDAIVYQVPQVATAMGAGLAGGLSVATVAANQLNLRWEELSDTFGESKPITTVAGMEKLGKETRRTAEEVARLNILKREPHQARSLQEIAEAVGPHNPGAGGDQGKTVAESQAEERYETFVDWMAGGEVGDRNTPPLASLQDRLAHLAHVDQGGDGTLGGTAYEQSTKSVAGEDPQLRKLQDIVKTLEDIRNLYAGTKTIGVKRRR